MSSGVRCRKHQRSPSMAPILEDCRASTGALKAAAAVSIVTRSMRPPTVQRRRREGGSNWLRRVRIDYSEVTSEPLTMSPPPSAASSTSSVHLHLPDLHSPDPPPHLTEQVARPASQAHPSPSPRYEQLQYRVGSPLPSVQGRKLAEPPCSTTLWHACPPRLSLVRLVSVP